MEIGLIGQGFVGSAISRRFTQLPQLRCTPISRSDNFQNKIKDVDFVIHCANSARRFIANSNPEVDRKETLGKTQRFLDELNGKPILLVSSISCRTQLNTPYGANRKDCEDLVLDYGGSVIRLGPMFGNSRDRDVVHDICENREIFVSRDSRQCFSSVEWNGAYIADNFSSISGVLEIGARDNITLGELAVHVNSRSLFTGERDDQFPFDFHAGPDVSEVLKFLDQLMSNKTSNSL
jgi:nucleoside-diphosphate-sugar epimerase